MKRKVQQFGLVIMFIMINSLLLAQKKTTTPAAGHYDYDALNGQMLNADKDGKIYIDKCKAGTTASVVLPNGEDAKITSYSSKTQTLLIDLSKVEPASLPLTLQTSYKGNLTTNKLALQKSVTKGASNITGPQNQSQTGADVFTKIAFWDADIIYKRLNLADKKALSDTDKKIILDIINQYRDVDYTDFNALFTNSYFKKVNSFNNQKDVFSNGNLQPLTKYNKNNKLATSQSSEGGTSKSVTDILGSLSGIDVTKYVQAFADFLRDRIKEELTEAYITKLKDWFSKNEELRYLMPKTWEVFSNNDIYNIPSMGPVYKAAFSEDLAGLAENFETMVFSMDKYKDLRTNDGFIAFMFAYHYADLNSKGYHPADILHRINNKLGYSNVDTSKVSYVVSVLTMFSDNLVDTSGTGWVKKEHLNLVNKDFMNIFFGLLKEKYGNLFTYKIGDKTLDSILNKTSDAGGKLIDILAVAKTIDSRIKEFAAMSADDKQKNAVGFFTNNADAILDLVETTATFLNLPEKTTAQFQKWKTIITNATDIAKALRDTTSNGIGKVAINGLAILAEFIKTKDAALFEKITTLTKFISDMAVAKTAADIKTVLNKYAAPPHSYKVNRMSKVTFSLASYAGLYMGLERNKNVDAGKFKDNSVGVTAPLGLAVNWGTPKNASWGFFFSMVDIGAALSYRWNNDTADIPNKITLGQIFAPGLHVVYGLRNSPLSLKAGYQLAPQLRRIQTDQNVIYSNGDVWRLSIGLSVDIPVFIFSYKKKE